MKVWGSAAPDKQRLNEPWGGGGIHRLRCARCRRRVRRPHLRPTPLQGVQVKAVRASKSWRTGAGRSSGRLGRSAWRGAALYDSEALVLLGATRGRTVRWSSRAGRAACRELEPTFLSRVAVYSRRDDNTTVARRGDDEDDPDMSLQSTAALGMSRSTTAPTTYLHRRRRHAPPSSAS
jgi:hypothetical protein